jgi:pantetheine-phosphate adenylyltransferase
MQNNLKNKDARRIAVYPGTFDPITNGHLDIIRRAAPIFEKVYITLAVNSAKQPLFTLEERLEMISKSIAGIPNVEATSFNGLVVDYAVQIGASVIIRGLRAISDFEYEFQIALMNRKQHQDVDTVFLMPDERYTYLSSSVVKEVASHGGKVECFFPPHVLDGLKNKFKSDK